MVRFFLALPEVFFCFFESKRAQGVTGLPDFRTPGLFEDSGLLQRFFFVFLVGLVRAKEKGLELLQGLAEVPASNVATLLSNTARGRDLVFFSAGGGFQNVCFQAFCSVLYDVNALRNTELLEVYFFATCNCTTS